MQIIKLGFLVALIAGVMALIFITATDRICDKPFSEEFKQTDQYKAMKCEA